MRPISRWGSALNESISLLKGESELEPPKAALARWIGETYGKAPVNIELQVSEKGPGRSVLILIYNRASDVPKIVESNVLHGSKDADDILQAADQFGVSEPFGDTRDGALLFVNYMEDAIREKLLDGIKSDQLGDFVKAFGNESIAMLMTRFGIFFVFADTTANREKFKDDFDLRKRLEMALAKLVQRNDPGGTLEGWTPKISFESEQELNEVYDNNLYQFFK